MLAKDQENIIKVIPRFPYYSLIFRKSTFHRNIEKLSDDKRKAEIERFQEKFE